MSNAQQPGKAGHSKMMAKRSGVIAVCVMVTVSKETGRKIQYKNRDGQTCQQREVV